MQLSISRFNPETDEKPYMQEYTVDTTEVRGNMLLDVLEHIKSTQDPSLSFRRSCGEGVCGSDGMNINGKNGLACITQIDKLPEKVVIHPLPSFPIIRDLIVDMTQFYEQYNRAEPYLQNDDDLPAKERLQSIEERAQLDGLYECIM
ncbi:MAG: succinate dehydrogenase iron-sulfur subunit, partial [Coxiellaceae bacterium]|nr:succinate dehydrogenase iron-sulfur subunit [Coxiellaceae bacterium]